MVLLGRQAIQWDRRPSTSSSGRCLLPVFVSACLGILKDPVHPVVKSSLVKQDHIPSCGKVWCLCNEMFPVILSEMEKNKLFVICPEDPSQTVPQIMEHFSVLHLIPPAIVADVQSLSVHTSQDCTWCSRWTAPCVLVLCSLNPC